MFDDPYDEDLYDEADDAYEDLYDEREYDQPSKSGGVTKIASTTWGPPRTSALLADLRAGELPVGLGEANGGVS